MHEIGITRRILEVALARASAGGAEHITAVHLEIGEESSVAPASVEFYWPQVSRSTPAEGARLVLTVADDPLACRMLAIDVEGAT
jgi:Zn finger protein HypA/HybF involved in hydrogenase expression